MPAAGAERRALDVAHLRLELRNAVGGRGRARAAIADREPADLAGRAQVAFEQRRREALRVGHVVEAVAVGVRRQVERRIDVEVEQVLHRRGVLGACQPLERTPSRDSGAPPPRDRARASRPRWSAVSTGGVGPLRARLAASCPADSLRTIFSATSGDSAARAGSKLASDSPPALPTIAVAPGAITLHHGPVGLGCRRRREPCRRPGRAWRAGSGRWSRNRRGGRRR